VKEPRRHPGTLPPVSISPHADTQEPSVDCDTAPDGRWSKPSSTQGPDPEPTGLPLRVAPAASPNRSVVLVALVTSPAASAARASPPTALNPPITGMTPSPRSPWGRGDLNGPHRLPTVYGCAGTSGPERRAPRGPPRRWCGSGARRRASGRVCDPGRNRIRPALRPMSDAAGVARHVAYRGGRAAQDPGLRGPPRRGGTRRRRVAGLRLIHPVTSVMHDVGCVTAEPHPAILNSGGARVPDVLLACRPVAQGRTDVLQVIV